MIIWGIDCSTSVIGFCIFENCELKNTHSFIFKPEDFLETKAKQFANYIKTLDLPDIVAIEEPAKMFQGNKSTANTISKLIRFNGMISYVVFAATNKEPQMVNVRSARKIFGIEQNKKEKKDEIKLKVIEAVKNKYSNFEPTYTKFNNPQKGVDDMADAIVVAYSVMPKTT